MERSSKSVDRIAWLGLAGFVVLTVVTFLLKPTVVGRFYPLAPDKGPAWYYWQLPYTTLLARLTYWIGYALHQVVVWVILFRARRAMELGLDARRHNMAAMGTNLLFVSLHLIQTLFWYDGLAQDVPIWTSQGSVIVMLVLILFLEIPRRGLFWGRSFSPPRKLYGFIRRWHGIYISWAIVYTFWFHPMDGNWGLMSGFVYMFLLFLQLSLFGTPLHMNRAWIVLLEVFVAVHATLITIYKSNPIWTMFLVGFLVMFVLTQMHAVSWLKKWRWPIAALFVVGVTALYYFVRGIEHFHEITFIPIALYGGTLALLLVGKVVERIGMSAGAAHSVM